MVAPVAGAEVVGAEVPVGLVACQDVVGGNQDGVRDGDRRPGGPGRGAQHTAPRGYVPVVRPAALAASVRLVRRHFDQLRFRPASL